MLISLVPPPRSADNNYCGLNYKSEFNFATWDKWAKTKSANPNVKVYIGAPASPSAAGEGYVGPATLAKYVADAQKKYDTFGGVMLWDADTAYSEIPIPLPPPRASEQADSTDCPLAQTTTASTRRRRKP